MKRRLSFLGMVALVGALVLAVSSCGKDYGKDINKLKDDVASLQSKISELDQKVNQLGVAVKSVTYDAATNRLTVSYTDGSPSTVLQLTSTSVVYPTIVENADGTEVTITFLDDKNVKRTYTFPLKKGSEDITDLQLMGWVPNYDSEYPLSMYGYNYNGIVALTDLDFYFTYIKEIRNAGGSNGTPSWNGENSNIRTWTAGGTGGMHTVLAKQVLTDVEANGIVLVVRVSPADIDASKIEFALQTTGLTLSSFNFGAASKVTIPMTRGGVAAESSAIWTIPLFDNGALYDNAGKFEALYYSPISQTPYVWAVTDGVSVSNYSRWGFSPEPAGPAQRAYVIEVGGNTHVTSYPSPSATFTESSSPVFDVVVGVDYAITDWAGSYVYDYFITADDAAVAAELGIVIDKANGTFRVTKNADPITPALATLTVTALQPDGSREMALAGRTKIRIRVVPAPLAVTNIPLGNVLVVDGTSTPDAAFDATNISGYLPYVYADLAKMFTELGSTNTTTWRSAVLGANLTSTSPTGAVEAKLMVGTDDLTADFFVFANPLAIAYTQSNNNPTTSASNAQKVRIQLPYAAENVATIAGPGGTPALAIGKEYTLTLTFRNVTPAAAVLNVVNITFTPVLPDLADVFTKEPSFWTGNTLNGYFPAGTEVTAYGSRLWSYPIYDVMAVNLGGNGGISKLGSPRAKDYIALSIAVPAGDGFRFPAKATGLSGANLNGDRWLTSNMGVNTFALATGVATPGTTYANIGWGSNNLADVAAAATNDFVNLNLAYNAAADIKVTAGKYLNTYTYSDAEIEALDFKLKVASGIEQGTIKPAAGTTLTVPYSGNVVSFITAKDIIAADYNSNLYSVFPEWRTIAGGAFASAFSDPRIMHVSVFKPATEGSLYFIVDKDGAVLSEPTPAVAPASPLPTNPTIAEQGLSYIGIIGNTLSITTETKIGFIITDVHGVQKEVILNLTLIKQ